jgi:hypothetical protein
LGELAITSAAAAVPATVGLVAWWGRRGTAVWATIATAAFLLGAVAAVANEPTPFCVF